MSYKFLQLKKATDDKHKYEAVFLNTKTDKKKTVKFGAKGYEDFTTHKDPERKERYIKRHEKREDWTDFLKPGTLSRFILWNKETIKDSLIDYLKRFNL
jgi:hypothetical protein